jgi:hypothetical protein
VGEVLGSNLRRLNEDREFGFGLRVPRSLRIISFAFAVLEIKPRTLPMLSMYATTKLHPSLFFFLINFTEIWKVFEQVCSRTLSPHQLECIPQILNPPVLRTLQQLLISVGCYRLKPSKFRH